MCRAIAIAAASVALFGCGDLAVRGTASEPASPSPSAPGGASRSINLSGFPPEYRRAFDDGCAAAKRGDSASRPRGDGTVAQGWSDGYAYCRPR
jgi:hypothetical protein